MVLVSQLIVAVALGLGGRVNAADPCASPIDFVEVGLVLHTVTHSSPATFVGEFQVHNVRLGKPLELGGASEKSRFSMDYPQVLLQFQDLNGQWQHLLMPPGTFSGPKDRLTIAPGETKSIFVELPSPDQVSAGGRQFRILVSTWKADLCIESTPFSALQSRGPVTGFVSAERSNKSLERTRAR
jgi:hypothetical protein